MIGRGSEEGGGMAPGNRDAQACLWVGCFFCAPLVDGTFLPFLAAHQLLL